MPEQRFFGRVALVTGASGGLGGAVARAFLSEGARVAAVARHSAALAGLRADADENQLLTVEAALTEPGAAARVVQAVGDWASGLDVLVNAVGSFSGGQPLAESSPDEWRQMLDSNLLAVLEMMRAALPALQARGGGRIVNVSSRAAQRIGPNVAAYTTAKAALETLTLATAEEYREHRITANAVAPSAIATPAMLQGATARQRERWVTPESIAGVILFLASDAAADVSGAIIPVYGRA